MRKVSMMMVSALGVSESPGSVADGEAQT
jgi:hypothetical protein